MGNGEEYFDFHLTPRGWEKGTEKSEFGPVYRDPPFDRYLTLRRTEYYGSWTPQVPYIEEVWSHADAVQVECLRKIFGQSPGEWTR